MNKRLAALSLAALSIVLGGVVVSCNSDNDSGYYDIDTGYTPETMYSSTAVTAFNLKADSKVLANLDSVFFTIDLEGQRIFNADSMPLGTDVRKLVPVIGTDGSSKIMVNYTDTLGVAQEIEYNSTTPDTICFTEPVKVTVTSLNETYSRSYTITVNVHKQQPDSLCWGDVAYSKLPTIASTKDAVTVEKAGMTYCYSTNGTSYQRAYTTDPATVAAGWTTEAVTFGFTPQLSTMTATDGDFYVLADNGNLWHSADGLSWQSTGQTWTWIYGGYEARVVGVASDGAGAYKHVTYPQPQGYVSRDLSADFPVGGTSPMLTFTSQWSMASQGIIAGGHAADGTLSSAVWGYDGQQWSKFSDMADGAALDKMVLFPYFTFRTNTTNWTVTEQSTIFAMGGRDGAGTLSRIVYVSRDLGVNWHKADSLMQMPEQLESFAGARAIVSPTILHARSANLGWNPVRLPAIPAWYQLDGAYGSRAVAPVTEWACPYIYIYGGEDTSGNLRDIVLRGVINRLTYKPIQ